MTKHFRIFLASVAGFLGITFLGLSCINCATIAKQGGHKSQMGGPISNLRFANRTIMREYEATVRLVVTCLDSEGEHVVGGTGFLIASRYVITAAHVTACNGQDGSGSAVMIKATLTDGMTAEMVIDKVAKEADAVRLVTTGTKEVFKNHPFAVLARKDPPVGAEVCIVTAIPLVTRSCGTVQVPDGNVMEYNFLVEPGNSGSALYGQDGRVIGIATQYRLCGPFMQLCYGRGWPISTWRDLLDVAPANNWFDTAELMVK